MQEATESQQKVKNRNNKNELTIDLKEEDALFVGEEERTGRILTVKSPNMVDFTEYIKLRNVWWCFCEFGAIPGLVLSCKYKGCVKSTLRSYLSLQINALRSH